MRVLADHLDTCCSLGLRVLHTVHKYSSHNVGVSVHSVAGAVEFMTPPASILIHFSPHTHMHACQAASLFFSTLLGLSCFASTVHWWFMVEVGQCAVIPFHSFIKCEFKPEMCFKACQSSETH